MTVEGMHELLDDVFEWEALAIGGLAALHPIDDVVLRALISDMREIRAKAHRRLSASNQLEKAEFEGCPTGSERSSSAVQEFMAEVRGTRGSSRQL